jgi:hypothetical protein
MRNDNQTLNRDVGLEVLACQDKQVLLDLIDTLNEAEDKKYRALIDERLDYLRD